MSDHDDDLLVEELRGVAAQRAVPVPGPVVAAARAAYTWRTVDEELAMLAYDSTTEDRELAGVRGDEPRLITYETEVLHLDVEVQDEGDTRSLTGEATPPPDRVALQHPGEEPVELALDSGGRFRTAGVAPGATRFRVEYGDRRITTEWVAI